MRLPGLLAGGLLACLVAGPATADLPFELIPLEPTSADELKIRITFENAGPLRFGAVWRHEDDPDTLQVSFDGEFFCTINCVTQVLEVPLGRLDAGHYDLATWGRIEGDFGFVALVGSFDVAPAGPSDGGYSPLQLEPMAPTDADRIRLTLPYQLAACEPDPSVLRLERQDQQVALKVLRPPTPSECYPAVPARLFALGVDLGQLAAGEYRVDLAEQETAGGAATPVASRVFSVAPTDASVVLLGRYRVSARWRTPEGNEGPAQPLAGRTDESALFSFFGPDNWELLVKVLDGCAINGHRWVFLAAATTVEFSLTVVDLEAPSLPYVHLSPGGSPAPPLTDIAAFACDP